MWEKVYSGILCRNYIIEASHLSRLPMGLACLVPVPNPSTVSRKPI